MITIIEGVGDEVVFCVGFAILVLVLVLAWSSTSVPDYGLIRTAVLIIERPRVYIASLDRQRRAFIGSTILNPGSNELQTGSASSSQDPRVETLTASNTVHSVSDSNEPIFPTNFIGATLSNISARSPDEAHLADESSPVAAPVVDQTDSSISCKLQTEEEACNLHLHKQSVPDGAVDVPSTEVNVDSNPSGTEAANQNVQNEEGGQIRVRLKFLNDTQKLVEAKLSDRLGNFRQQHFGDEIGSNKIVRLIFNGQLLQRDQETLRFHGLFDNCVVHCHITSNNTSTVVPSTPIYSPQVEFDIGRIMMPLFFIILVLIWCCRIQYRQYFNMTSTLALMCITGLFVVSVYGIFLPERNLRARLRRR